MKKLLILGLLLTAVIAWADITAVTKDGREVLLKDDGTWEYLPKEEVLDKGKWEIREDINPVDDSKTITFILKADEGEGIYGDPIYLILRYKSGETQVYINWHSYLGSEASVLTRYGDSPAFTTRWDLSTNTQATFAIASHIGLLIAVDRLVAQVTPYNENPITAIFDVRGLKEAIIPYNDILKWF